MKKVINLFTADILCASCPMFTGCSNSRDSETPDASEADATEAFLDIDSEGTYRFYSIQIEQNGEITAIGLGTDWDGVTLTKDYAAAELGKDGTVTLTGALEAEGTWYFDESGIFLVERTLTNGDVWSQSVSTDGETTSLNMDVYLDDDSIVSYYYSK